VTILCLNRQACICLLLLVILPAIVDAKDFGSTIKKADIALQGDSYTLSADIDYRLSEAAYDALKNGVPLFWNVEIKIRQRRSFLWDKTLVEKTLRYRIQYHALLSMYRVRNENTGFVDNFSSLKTAMELISSLNNFHLFDKNQFDPKKTYIADLKVIFDREALPLPLRPVSYLDSQWYLSSNRYVWSLNP